MATKAEMIRARKNAYDKGYSLQRKDMADVIENPYSPVSSSNTYTAFELGTEDARKGVPYRRSTVENS